jgi:hypothetical protein
VASGTPEELSRQAAGGVAVTVSLRGEGSDMEGGLHALSVAQGVEFLGRDGEALRYRVRAQDGVDAGRLAEAVSALAALRGWALRELTPRTVSLEDVFRELTTREDMS